TLQYRAARRWRLVGGRQPSSGGSPRRAWSPFVPADAFYEWKVIEGGKQPSAIARQDGQPMAFGGLWESFRWPHETVPRSFTILPQLAQNRPSRISKSIA